MLEPVSSHCHPYWSQKLRRSTPRRASQVTSTLPSQRTEGSLQGPMPQAKPPVPSTHVSEVREQSVRTRTEPPSHSTRTAPSQAAVQEATGSVSTPWQPHTPAQSRAV